MGEAEAARAPRTEADVATWRLQMSEVTVSVGANAPAGGSGSRHKDMVSDAGQGGTGSTGPHCAGP